MALQHPSADDWSLSPSQAEYVDRVCSGFETAWKAVSAGGQRPPIEQYLADAPDRVRDVLLQELLNLEVAYRHQFGEETPLEEYRQRFPDYFGEVNVTVQSCAPRWQIRLPGMKAAESSDRGGPTVWTDGKFAGVGEALPTGPLPGLPALDRPSVPGYEILEELGRGGMGIVYKARQTSLKRLVALKMIRDSAFAGPEHRIRFRREAEAVARLQHANIIQIHEIGEHAGLPFFSMEYAEGGSLAQKLAVRPLPAAEAAELVRTLAEAVDHAHQRNVIHRDLKPANVLLAGDGRPLITDFGLAKLLDGDTSLSVSGAILGTASYMAPEQAEGRTREVGPATDVYALGAILYELLTGGPPFRAETWQATVQQVIHDDPPPPRQLQPDVPTDLEQICLKCLAKDPGRRYNRAADLAEDLRRFLAGEPLCDMVGPFGGSGPPGIPGFEVLEPLGQGDDRVRLFKVRELSSGRLACLKMLRELVGRDDLERFCRTVLPVLNRLQHPNLVRVYDCGARGEWRYLVQEFMPGGSLRRRIGSEPQPVRGSVELVESLARTIQVVHDHGLVHGNLEPANVLLEADGTPRIAEVGLVNQPGRASARPADEVTGTMSWRISSRHLPDFVGNLRYLAPEVIYSDTGPYSDVYGLGAILYHLLTGRPPFVSDSLAHLFAQTLKLNPTPPSNLRPEVQAELGALCLTCLHKEPTHRYPSAGALAEELRRFLNGGAAAILLAKGRKPPRGPSRA
jgi:serine/threonine protein kinase